MWKKNIAKLLVFAMLLTMLPFAVAAETGVSPAAATGEVSADYAVISDVKVTGKEGATSLTCANAADANGDYTFGDDTVAITPNDAGKVEVSFKVVAKTDCSLGDVTRNGQKVEVGSDGVVTEQLEASAATNLEYAISATKNDSTLTYKLKLMFTVSKTGEASITISGPTTVKEGESIDLIATVKNAAGETMEKPTITWTSSPAGVVTVTNGKVTGVKEGEATITATATVDLKSVSKTHTVTVTAASGNTPEPGSYTIDMDTTLMVEEGATKPLTATVKNDKGEAVENAVVTLKSEDESVATVKDGVVTGVKAGTTTITASATVDGKDVTAKCAVTVTAKGEEPALTITLSTDTLDLLKGSKTELTVEVSPADAVINWASDNSEVASVVPSDDGKSATVTAVADGTAKITVTATYGKQTDTKICLVNVKTVEGVDSIEETKVETPTIEAKGEPTEEQVSAMETALAEIKKPGGIKVDLTNVASAVTKNKNGDLQIEGAEKVIEATAIEQAVKQLNVPEGSEDDVRTVLVPSIVPSIVGAEVRDSKTISITYDLKAFVSVFVTLQSDKEEFDEENAVKAADVQITDTKQPVSIELKVDAVFLSSLLNPVVKHPRHNGTFWHKAFKGEGSVRFTNKRGFSEVGLQDLSETPDGVQAEYDAEYYSLSEAIKIADSKATITVVKDGLSATVSKELSFKLGDGVKTLDIKAGSGYEVTESNGIYTVTKKNDSGNNNSGSTGGGGGGSSKPAIKPGDQNKPTTPTTTPGGGVAGFNDVATSAWYADSVKYVVDKGLFGGVGNGNFAPNANMTRAMMWTVLARYMGVNTNTGSNWYEAARTWAMAQNISDGTMADGNVTREQFVTMLWRLSGEPAVETSASFTDNGSISGYAKTAVDWAVAQGILNGYNDGSFRPQGSATRAEVAKMLTVFCQNADNAEPTESETESEA